MLYFLRHNSLHVNFIILSLLLLLSSLSEDLSFKENNGYLFWWTHIKSKKSEFPIGLTNDSYNLSKTFLLVVSTSTP